MVNIYKFRLGAHTYEIQRTTTPGLCSCIVPTHSNLRRTLGEYLPGRGVVFS